MMEITGSIRIINAMSLPKVEALSKIDAYVVLKQNGAVIGKTKAVDNNEDPVWNQVFPVVLHRDAQGKVHGNIDVILYDENTFKDKLVGSVSLDLSKLSPQQLLHQEVAIGFAENKFAKQGKNSRMGITITPGVLAYNSMRAMWGALPGCIIVDHKKQLYLPFNDPAKAPLYLGIEYDGPNIDIKVFVCVPGIGIHTDMYLNGRAKSKIKRNQWPNGTQIAPGLTAYQEIFMDDVPPHTDFNQLSVIVHDATYLGGTNAADVVKAHGWKGALNFKSACQTLSNIMVDEPEEEIYMEVDQGQTFMIVDWDKDDVDIKLAVLTNPTTSDKAYDLTINGQTVKKTSEIYMPPKQVLGGKLTLARLFQLDDLKYGSSLKTIEIHRLQLTSMRTFNVQGLCRIMG